MATSQSQSFRGGSVSPGQGIHEDDIKTLVINRKTDGGVAQQQIYDPLQGNTFNFGRLTLKSGGELAGSYDPFDADGEFDFIGTKTVSGITPDLYNTISGLINEGCTVIFKNGNFQYNYYKSSGTDHFFVGNFNEQDGSYDQAIVANDNTVRFSSSSAIGFVLIVGGMIGDSSSKYTEIQNLLAVGKLVVFKIDYGHYIYTVDVEITIQGYLIHWIYGYEHHTTLVRQYGNFEHRVYPVPYVTPEMFGAVGNGIADDTAAIRQWATHKRLKAFGTYLITNTDTDYIDLVDGQTIDLRGASFINDVGGGLFKGYGINTVTIIGGKFTGAGCHDVVTNAHALFFENCDNCKIDSFCANNAQSDGIRLIDCSHIVVENCVCEHNVNFGIESKGGIGNVYKNNVLTYNGINIYGTTFTYGRGIVVYMEHESVIDGNFVAYNDEYGIRIYSNSSDADISTGVQIVNNSLIDNGNKAEPAARNDIYVYNEGDDKVYNTLVSGNTVFRSKKGTCLAINGNNSVVSNNVCANVANTDVSVTGIVFYGVANVLADSNMFLNVSNCISFSGTDLCSDITFTHNQCTCTKVCSSMHGTNIIIDANKFTSYNPDSISNDGVRTDSNTSGRVSNNIFDGYNQAIVTGDVPTLIFGNTTVNSVTNGLRKYGDSTDYIYDNNFDVAYPLMFGTLRHSRASGTCKIAYMTAPPSSGTWTHGDIVFNNNPSPGYGIGWVCTADGTPGTWKSFGTISS